MNCARIINFHMSNKRNAAPAKKSVQFTHEGFTYRTNEDASIVEGLDGSTWNRTYSLKVRTAAQEALLLDYAPWQATYSSEDFNRIQQLAMELTDFDRKNDRPTCAHGYSAERVAQAEKIVRDAQNAWWTRAR